MKLGCHCVLFKERIATETKSLLAEIAKTGFQGVELGIRFFGTERKDDLNAALSEAGLSLAGLHAGAPMEMWADAPGQACEIMKKAAMFLRGLPGKNLIMSGQPVQDPVRVAEGIDAAARACAELGVTLHYHNHAGEFLDGAAMYNALRDRAPNVKFGFDLGWVQKGGFDPYRVLEDNRGRVSYVHLRDYDKPEGREFPDLGGGGTDFSRLMPYLRDYLPEDGWAVVEYETGEEDLGRYARACEFLKKYIG